MALTKRRKSFLLLGLLFIVLGIYLSWAASQDKLNLPYRIVPHTSGTPTDPGDILFIGDTQVLSWQNVVSPLQEKLSYKLRTPLRLTFRGLENGGIHRVIAYLQELLQTPQLARPQMVVYALGRHELQEYKMRTVMLHRIKHQLARESDPLWSTVLQLLPFLRPWIINPGEPIILDELRPWPEIEEGEELLYREVATTLFHKELAILASLVKQAKIKFVVLTAPLNLAQVPAVWPSATSVTLQKVQQQISSYLQQGQFKVAAQLIQPLLALPGNARTWYEQGRIQQQMNDFEQAMQAWRTAVSLNADRDEALPTYNIIAQQSANDLNFALYDLQAPAENYFWALYQNNSPDLLAWAANFPGKDFYQAQAAELGTFLQQTLLRP